LLQSLNLLVAMVIAADFPKNASPQLMLLGGGQNIYNLVAIAS
jgi:hypothetical protein